MFESNSRANVRFFNQAVTQQVHLPGKISCSPFSHGMRALKNGWIARLEVCQI